MAQRNLLNQLGDNPYDGVAIHYGRARPDYPPAALAILQVAAGDRVVDVGAGTGIFSRQLAWSYPDARIVGVEPGADMRSTAEAAATDVPNLSFVAGSAEALPFPDSGLALVTAATAAHWFDRPRFYAEAFRALRVGGRIAIVQSIRRFWESPFLAAYEALHEDTVPGYRRGTFPAGTGGFAAIDAFGELRRHEATGAVQRHAFDWDRPMTRETFIPFSLSSSITRRAILALGETEYLARLNAIIDRHGDASGGVEVPYLTTVVMAAKASAA